MVISRTSTVADSIQAVSPLLTVGSAAAAGAAAGACAISANATSKAIKQRHRAKTIVASPASPRRVGVLSVMVEAPVRDRCGMRLQRCSVGLAGADAHGVVERDNEDLAVTDLAGLGRPGDRLNDPVDQGGIDSHLDLHFGQEVHCVLSAAVDLGVPLLAPIPLDLRDRQTVYADRSQR